MWRYMTNEECLGGTDKKCRKWLGRVSAVQKRQRDQVWKLWNENLHHLSTFDIELHDYDLLRNWPQQKARDANCRRRESSNTVLPELSLHGKAIQHRWSIRGTLRNAIGVQDL